MPAGREVAEEYMASLGQPSYAAADGSGLSRNNQVSAQGVMNVVRHMYLNPATKSWVNTLAIAGVDGTIRNRMRGSSTRGRVFAKTGTLRDVVALSGLIKNQFNGHTYFFSFLMNDVPNLSEARGTMDRVVGLMASNFADPIPDVVGQQSTMNFLAPAASSPRTVRMEVDAASDIVSVQYFAEDRFFLGESSDRTTNFGLSYRYNTPGNRSITAYGYNNRRELVSKVTTPVQVRDEDLNFAFVSPIQGGSATVPNPVTLALNADASIASVEYLADDQFSFEASNLPSTGFAVEYSFFTLGKRKITAVGRDAQGNEVARTSITLTVFDPDKSMLELVEVDDVENNPVTFKASTSPDIVRVEYTAENQFILGESLEEGNQFEVTYNFFTVGARRIVVHGYREGETTPAITVEKLVNVVNPNLQVNKLGAWLWRIEQTGETHASLARRLKALGVKRIYLKVADGSASCSRWPELCDPAVPAVYKAQGIEPWGWSYNYPRLFEAQADALFIAARSGYEGFVVDIEMEFDGLSTEVHQIMGAFADARDQAVRDGVTGSLL